MTVHQALGEGLPEMTVTVQGNNHSFSETVMTDDEGVWRIFVPIRDVYDVSVEKEGFETVYYETENQSGYTVHDSPDSTDAGNRRFGGCLRHGHRHR